jgi:phosphoribosylcarboxyaminoimidazole (NCAIR) mutase
MVGGPLPSPEMKKGENMGHGVDGAINAGLQAARILAGVDTTLAELLQRNPFQP